MRRWPRQHPASAASTRSAGRRTAPRFPTAAPVRPGLRTNTPRQPLPEHETHRRTAASRSPLEPHPTSTALRNRKTVALPQLSSHPRIAKRPSTAARLRLLRPEHETHRRTAHPAVMPAAPPSAAVPDSPAADDQPLPDDQPPPENQPLPDDPRSFRPRSSAPTACPPRSANASTPHDSPAPDRTPRPSTPTSRSVRPHGTDEPIYATNEKQPHKIKLQHIDNQNIIFRGGAISKENFTEIVWTIEKHSIHLYR